MAIDIPSDLVADVMRAADPDRLRNISVRLGVTDLDSHGSVDFRSTVEALDVQVLTRPDSFEVRGDHAGQLGGEDNPFRDFEQLLLKSFVEAMLPPGSSGAFGEDSSSGVWRSMFADKIAETYADAGGLGLAAEMENSSPAAESSSTIRDGSWPYFRTDRIQSFAG